MKYFVPGVLVFVALIHALPVLGVLGQAKLHVLYGVRADDHHLELLLRHRAVLFGLLAALLVYAALHPPFHRIALVAGLVSVGSFLLLALPGGQFNSAIQRVIGVDWIALFALAAGLAVHFWPQELSGD